ncbi:transmembrane protein 26-like [Littorina saxatilis]|uniref:Transmembrane protein 26 n=1 Tax=Littorina saxatilis TaxID=31220 RepID=A0AAN9GLG4_9CAEN
MSKQYGATEDSLATPSTTPTSNKSGDNGGGGHSALAVEVEDGDSLCAAFLTTYHVIVALLVRSLLLVHALVAVWLVVTLKKDNNLWALIAINVLLLAETYYTVVKRKGRESKWFCPCFLAYLVTVLPPVWLIELYRLQRFTDVMNNSTTTNTTGLAEVSGLTVPIKLEPELWVSVVEQTLLFLLVLCRWLLPRGDISRHELSQLLFVFLGIASDNMGLFELFDEPAVRSDPILTYVIMAVWSVSFAQFLFVLTATKSPQQVAVIHDNQSEETKQRRKQSAGLLEVIFTTEIWSLIFSVMTQDGPYGAVRIYTVTKHNLITYSIIFYICKNLLVVCLVLYRLMVICVHMGEDDDNDDNDTLSTPGSRRSKDQ